MYIRCNVEKVLEDGRTAICRKRMNHKSKHECIIYTWVEWEG